MGFLKDMFTKMRIKNELQINEMMLANEQYKYLLETSRGYSRDYGKAALEDPDEAQWTDYADDDRYQIRRLRDDDIRDMREKSYQMYYRNTHGHNAVRNIEKYVVGRGFSITPLSSLPEVKMVWDNFWKVNGWAFRKKEYVRRTMRDGETFLRFFKKVDTLLVRFLNPGFIDDPKIPAGNGIGLTTYGIETNPEDIEDVWAYWYRGQRIESNEVYHLKILADSDVKRGRSYYEVIANELQNYRDWLRARMKLNRVRSSMALVRKLSGGGTQAANIVSQNDTASRKAPDGSYYQKAMEDVSILTTNRGVEYNLLSPNLQAADVQHDGRSFLLSISAGLGQPEFMTTMDASNGNYSSIMMAESPGVKEFEDWQDTFKQAFKDIYAKVINTAIADGLIPEYESVLVEEVDELGNMTEVPQRIKTNVDCDVVFPEIVNRDIQKETQAIIQQEASGYISRRTAQIKLGYDPESEDRQIKKEEAFDEPEEPEESQDMDKDFEQMRKEETSTEDVE